MRKILGIDPGLSGGLSIIDEQLNFIAAFRMPVQKSKNGKNHVDCRKVAEIISQYAPDLTVIEAVGARPGQGVTSMFSFGEGYGIVKALAETLCVNTIYARPQEWRGFQSMSGLSKPQIAEIAYEVFQAEEIYGKARKGKRAVRDGISDSLMIAKYGIRFLE